MSVADIMSKAVISLELDDDLSKAKNIFEQHDIHHIIINTEDGRLAGIVDDCDLYKHLSPTVGTKKESPRDTSLLAKKVHQIMARDVISTPATLPLNDTVILFHRHKISCLPVVDENSQVIGIVTWRDIIKLLAKHYQAKKLKEQKK